MSLRVSHPPVKVSAFQLFRCHSDPETIQRLICLLITGSKYIPAVRRIYWILSPLAGCHSNSVTQISRQQRWRWIRQRLCCGLVRVWGKCVRSFSCHLLMFLCLPLWCWLELCVVVKIFVKVSRSNVRTTFWLLYKHINPRHSLSYLSTFVFLFAFW